MDLELITLRLHSYSLSNVNSVSMTSDMKLLSRLTEDHTLLINSVTARTIDALEIPNVYVYCWQEDVNTDGCYQVMCIGSNFDVFFHNIFVNSSDSDLSLEAAIELHVESMFENFPLSLKGVSKLKASDILKYQEKEVIISFNNRFVVTFFLSSGNSQIISFVDVCENGESARKILLVKEAVFVLSATGSTLSVYSLSSNSKMYAVDLIKSNLDFNEAGSVESFVVSSEKDVILFQTKFSKLFCLSVEDAWDMSGKSSENASSKAVVSAFTKQFPSVQRVRGSSHNSLLSAVTGLLQPVVLPLSLKNVTVSHMALFNGKLFYLLSSDSSSVVGIHALNSENASSVNRLLDCHCCVVTASSDTFPLLLLQEQQLLLVLHGIECNRLVNELMIYHCSKAAESLSSLNHWQNIHINVEVLKEGLRNRQLNSIKFFLQTHEEGFCQLLENKSSGNATAELKSEFDSWVEIMGILLSTIESMFTDYQSQQFVKELLKISTIYVINLLEDVSCPSTIECAKEFQEVKSLASAFFSKCLRNLRNLLDDNCYDKVTDAENKYSGSLGTLKFPEKMIEQWEEWDKKDSWKEIAADAIMEGKVAVAQSYFLHHHSDLTGKVEFEEFQKLGLELVTGYLKHKLIPDAATILLNLGISVNEKFISIFKTTCDREIRESLLEELQSSDLLSKDDLKLVQFAATVETNYPCSSFLQAEQLLEEKSISLEEWYKCAVKETKTEPLVVGDLVEPSWANCETGAYCRLVFHWLSDWDRGTYERVLLPQIFKGLCEVDAEISPTTAWNYLLEYGDSAFILKWISHWVGRLPSNSSNDFPYCCEITPSMIDSVKDVAPLHVCESVLNELARYGVFCTQEQELTCALLSRIGSAGYDVNEADIFASTRSTLAFTDLCHKLVHYCLDHKLTNFLVTYITKHYYSFISWPLCDSCDLPLLKLIKSFGKWRHRDEDSALAFDAMVVSAEFIYKLPNLSIKSLLTQVPAPLNVAILLFCGKALQTVIKEESSSIHEITALGNLFPTHPLLRDSLLESTDSRQLPELSVYQLLQGNSPFDPAKLFGWQSTNLLKSDEALAELPHFLMSQLSDHYGLKEPLTHFYYLVEGRPNFAYLKFIAQEITSGNRICYSRVHLCCQEVFHFALLNFRNEKICVSCVLFLEMLGQDSLPLRVSLINANGLFKHRCQQHSEDAKSRIFQEISSLFQNALEDKEAASNVIAALETDIMQQHSDCQSSSLIEDLVQWMPVVCLANFYDVPVGDTYLSRCAKSDNWLNFLAFSQVFQLPKEQVQSILREFSNQCIGNHLAKALEKKTTLSSDIMYNVTKRKYPKKKDLRKSLYSRIGLIKDPTTTAHDILTTQELDEETTSVCSFDTSTSSDPESGSFVIMKDLFMQILQAYGTDAPWLALLRASYAAFNPVLSLLAASSPESEITCCLAIWLLTSLPKGNVEADDENLLQVLMSSMEEDLEKLVIRAMKENKLLLLLQGFSVFLPDSPLVLLAQYFVSFFVYKEFDSSEETLRQFLQNTARYKETKFQHSYQSLIWIENMMKAMLEESVVTCSTSYERLILLSHLSCSEITPKHVRLPDFKKLYHMVSCLPKLGDAISIESFMLPSSDPSYKTACWEAAKRLVQLHLYDEAKNFSAISGITPEEVFLLQISQDSEEFARTEKWNFLINRIAFWKEVMNGKQNNFRTFCILEFLKDKCSTSDRFGEKCFLNQLIIQCHKQNQGHDSGEELFQYMTAMWWCLLKSVQKEQLSVEELNALLPSETVCSFDEIFDSGISLQEEEEIKAVEEIISHLLMKKKLHQAFQVARIFNHTCTDLEIVEQCFKLARREISPKDCYINDNDDAKMVPSPSRKKSVASWASGFNGSSSSSHSEIVDCIQRLCGRAEIATPICEQILVNFLAAMVLNRSYDEISAEDDHFAILKNILSSKYKDKYSLARSLIQVYELRDENVASFLSAEICASIRMMLEVTVLLPESTVVVASDEEQIYNPESASESFQLAAKLCQDPSLLGKKLMDIVSTLFTNYEVAADVNDLFVMVELCICAHNCFTAACNIEGISQVLHKCKVLVRLLAEAKKFSLMVNLLIGIKRYGEMKYIFETLHEHTQFESQLLKRKLCEVPNLKLALLEYLKSCPASDNYYSALVHSFNMEREIAQDREISARANLQRLCKNSSDPDLKRKLTEAMKDLVAAAENYCAADCLLQAQICAELVNLVALQIHLCDSGTWVIGLDDNTVATYITEWKEFSEALIIAEAYKHHRSWNQAVLHNVIFKGNRNYYRELSDYLGISESLIQDVANSYYKLPNKTDTNVKNMKWLLSHCQNLQLKYELARLLDLEDVILDLTMGENAAFIQDLISSLPTRS